MSGGGTKVGSAYLSVVPKLSSDFGSKVSAPGAAHGREYGDNFSSGAGSALRVGAVALGNILADALEAAAVKAGDAFKTAFEGYAQREQLVGGVETLFGTRGAKDIEEYAEIVHKSVDEVVDDFASHQRAQAAALDYANMAFKTAGMSANDYMEQTTSSAAALIQSLGGDTEKAVEYANMAVIDMSDNANKMGTDIGRITDAYSGFSRQNFTMLDNLKLGYQGTRSEMERLLKDAEAIKAAHGEVAEYSIDSYADIVEAIHVVQEEMGIAGTTASEAASTIQGSMGMARAAFDNFLAGLADPDADMDQLTEDLAMAIGTALENVVPAVIDMGGGIVSAIGKGLEMLGFEGASEALDGFIAGIYEFSDNIYPKLAETGGKVSEFIQEHAEGFGRLADAVGGGLELGLTAVMDFAQFVMDNFGAVSTLVGGVAGGMVAFKAAMMISDAVSAFQAGMAAAAVAEDGLAASQGILNAVMNANPIVLVVSAIGALVAALVTAYTTNEDFRAAVDEVFGWIGGFVGGAIETVGGFLGDLVGWLGEAAEGIGQFASDVAGFFGDVADNAGEAFDTVKSVIESDLEDAKTVGSESMSALTSLLAGDWDAAADHAATAYETVKSNITGKLDAAKETAGGIADEIGAILGFPGLGDTVRDVFDGVKGFIEDPIGTARDFVMGIPDEIAGFFSGLGQRITDAIGSIYFPSPHVSWGSLDIGGVLEVPLPYVDWYAQGAIFPPNDPRLIGIGDATEPEAAAPISDLKGYVSEAVEEGQGKSGLLAELRALREDVRNLKLAVYMDSRKVAGEVYPYIGERAQREVGGSAWA